MKFIQGFLHDYDKRNYKTLNFAHQTPGFLILCEIHHSSTQKVCPRTDPFCQKIPLEYTEYKCHLTYSVARVNIDLGLYEPIQLKNRINC